MHPGPPPTRWQRALPWALIWLRLLLAPVAVVLALVGAPGPVWLAQFGLAAWSDVYDGRLARRYGVVSPGLRQADSVVDTLYFLGVLGSMIVAHPAIVEAYRGWIALVIGLEFGRYPLDWWRFGRGASYHATSARVFGATLVVAVVSVMGFGVDAPWMGIALAAGVLSALEGVAISLVLPAWTHDVASLRAALRIRRESSGPDRPTRS